jgi:hypothetical protein
MVVDILSNLKTTTRRRRKITKTRCPRWWEPTGPATCAATILVCGSSNAQRLYNDENEHGHTFNIENKTRRKVGYRHMFRVVNGGPEKRSSKTPPGMRRNWRSGSSQTINTWDSWRSETLLLNLVTTFSCQ